MVAAIVPALADKDFARHSRSQRKDSAPSIFNPIQVNPHRIFFINWLGPAPGAVT
jgi:hypothetical protein